MNILAIDTSTKYLCIGISKDSKLVVDYNIDVGRQQSRDLLPILKGLLSRARLEIFDIDVFGIGLGPGSFTGLRIGFSSIKGLNFAFKKPVVGISSLETICCNAINLKASLFCPIVDARRNLVYASIYKRENSGFRTVLPSLLIEPRRLVNLIKEDVIFMGDGLTLYKGIIKDRIKTGFRFLPDKYWFPRANNLMRMVCDKIKDANSLRSFQKRIFPVYLYPQECQVRKGNGQ